MNFHMTFKNGRDGHLHARILLKLKLTLIILTTVILQSSAASFAQITINEKSVSLESILQRIRKQSGYDFFYSTNMLDHTKPVSINVKNAPVEEVLKIAFKNQPLTYIIDQKAIILSYSKVTSSEIGTIVQKTITGKITDERGGPIPGASIRVKGLPTAPIAISDGNGNFMIAATDEQTLVISFIGYETQEVVLKDRKLPLLIKLKEKETTMKDVVITGTGINRNKDSFTGTTATFSGDDLKAISNNNVIQALRTADPSFLVIENNLAGSNPNVMPVIEVRGKSSIPSATLRDQFGNDPNQPLFVLDGFPTSLQTIVDLDMNRVASVTILKDAASTALYGSQASNGVIVIETVKPKPGELRFTYTQDFRLELPDLTAYNMMNASEKLEFERLSGRYNAAESSPSLVVDLGNLYAKHLAAVQKGVDSYWLSEPLQNGYSTNSSINASGGDNAFTYNVGMNYRTGRGAMIGSGRDSYSGSINLTYRKNKININNITYIRGNKTSESNYGSFSNFVNANPYFEKTPDNRYLEVSSLSNGTTNYVTNPLFDAMQPQYNNSKNTEVQNNLNVNYDINKAFRLTSALQITKGTTSAKTYKSPEMSDFLDVTLLRKGRYTDNRVDNFSYQGNLMLTFYKTIKKHNITANWRNTIAENNNSAYTTVAEGFPEGSLGNPRFAYSYLLNGAPTASSGVFRSLNSAISANYSFDNKYLFDFVYRIDGSTAYGRNKQFSPYYSFGLGWNLHHENFIKNKSWINSLRLTGNIGITGNQNFANISSVSIYSYNSNTNYNQFGQGVSLDLLGNPDLAPQKTRQISTSLDFNLFKGRFVGYLNAYNKKTNPLIVPIDLPSSTGVFSYPYNVGSLTYQGLETKLTFFPVYNLAQGITWNIGLTASSYKSRYDGFGNILNTLNKQQENNKTLVRYIDGNSAEAIWAIKSLGIDPANGREVFLTSDGQYTYDYTTANIANVGNTVPFAEGVISTGLRYKGFSFSVGFRYRLGGDVFNTALFNKVENITFANIANNQDKRALYDRWKNPGDVVQFKGISQTATTQISSRFVQRENTLSSETLNIGYTFDRQPWVKKLGMQSLMINALANDFLYLSTIRRERGIDYPFARTVSFSLRASF